MKFQRFKGLEVKSIEEFFTLKNSSLKFKCKIQKSNVSNSHFGVNIYKMLKLKFCIFRANHTRLKVEHFVY